MVNPLVLLLTIPLLVMTELLITSPWLFTLPVAELTMVPLFTTVLLLLFMVPLFVMVEPTPFTMLPLIVRVPPKLMVMVPLLVRMPPVLIVSVAPFGMTSVVPEGMVSSVLTKIVAVGEIKFQVVVAPCCIAMLVNNTITGSSNVI
jgi:hypothetical protein